MSNHPTDPELRKALLDLRTSRGITNGQVGSLFGRSHTFISKYINDNLDHDPKDFDARAWDILRAIAAKLDLSTQLIENSVSRIVTGRIDMARKTSDVCLIHGDAGAGKSSAAQLYVAANPSTIYHKFCGKGISAKSVQSAIYRGLGPVIHEYSTPRWDVIVKELKGSTRVIIADNAHRLDRTGRNCLFDLNEETGCAVVLIANPEILKRIKADDQQHSRIGVAGCATWNSETGKSELPQVAREVAMAFWSAEAVDEFADLAAFIASRPGQLRAVRKTTILANELAAKNPKLDPRSAFRAAHRQLVQDYALPND